VDFFYKRPEELVQPDITIMACGPAAGVGIVGIATNNKDYVTWLYMVRTKMARAVFNGTDGWIFFTGWLLYRRTLLCKICVLPFYLFANALDHASGN